MQRLLAGWSGELQGMAGQPVQDKATADELELHQKIVAREEEVGCLALWHMQW